MQFFDFLWSWNPHLIRRENVSIRAGVTGELGKKRDTREARDEGPSIIRAERGSPFALRRCDIAGGGAATGRPV